MKRLGLNQITLNNLIKMLKNKVYLDRQDDNTFNSTSVICFGAGTITLLSPTTTSPPLALASDAIGDATAEAFSGECSGSSVSTSMGVG